MDKDGKQGILGGWDVWKLGCLEAGKVLARSQAMNMKPSRFSITGLGEKIRIVGLRGAKPQRLSSRIKKSYNRTSRLHPGSYRDEELGICT